MPYDDPILKDLGGYFNSGEPEYLVSLGYRVSNNMFKDNS